MVGGKNIMGKFFDKLIGKIVGDTPIDWDQLEADLVASDLGIRQTMMIVDELQQMGRKVKAEDVQEKVKNHINETLPEDVPALKPLDDGKPYVITMVGVNGVGKTTSSAKLAHSLQKQGYSVLLVAADTFRAAAVEQLEAWAQRLDVPFLKGAPNADPSSVCYTAHEKASKEGIQFVICDTAGRLHTKQNLMSELDKIKRTLQKHNEDAPHLSLLVVDATTGANAMQQAKEFSKAVTLDGLIVTKLDGSGKGGVLVAIYRELGIPTRFLGTGEEPEQFETFARDRFVNELL